MVLSERSWRAHEKERQVFLFDMGILLCRRQELSLGKIKYVYKQKLMVIEIVLVSYDVFVQSLCEHRCPNKLLVIHVIQGTVLSIQSQDIYFLNCIDQK